MMIRKKLGVFVTLLTCVALCVAAGPETGKPAAKSLLDPDVYIRHIKYLASDELGGRLPGTEGIELAAEYIADQFRSLGLKPGGEDGTFFQSFKVRQGKELVDKDARLVVEGSDRAWAVRRDWIPLPFTDMLDVEGPLAFAGYGIRATEYDYDDYEEFDAEGKILLVFRYEPRSDDPAAEFGGADYSRHSMFRHKAREAARQGAAALLIVDPPLHPNRADTLYEFRPEATEQTFDVPLVHVSREMAAALVKKAGLGSLEELQTRLDKERKPLSADMNMNVVLHTGVSPRHQETRNVIGLLQATGDSDEFLVIGAHYDHLGTHVASGHGDEPVPFNGADDNASGTAGVIELARVLAAEGGLRHNVLFIAFSAEEMGLLGSRHFARHPTVDIEKIRAMFNFDMIGRLNQDQFTIYGTGTAEEFGGLVSTAAERNGLEHRAPPGVADMSDHAPFYRNDIPVLFAFTGVHKQYHRPDDDWELIDAPGATRILKLFAEIVREVDALENGPTFTRATQPVPPEHDEKKPAVEHARETEDQGPAGAQPDASGREDRMPARPAVRLGIMPDVAGADPDKPGMVAVSVIDGGPAKAAGMKDGDRIVRIGDRTVKDIYSYMDALKACKAGDVVDVIVVRDGKEITLKVSLQPAQKRHGGE